MKDVFSNNSDPAKEEVHVSSEEDELVILRQKIDECDREIVRLFEDRMQTAASIAAYKKKNGLPVYDPAREQDKLMAIRTLAGEKMGDYTAELYSEIFRLSRNYQTEIMKNL